MNTIEVQPNLSNFINSFREIGYTPEVAIADILDNSITAKSTEIQIFTGEILNPYICIVDNGLGMDENELIEAMRLASKNSKDNREQNDLGRFGLGLKTASFSQCKKLTVVSKKNNQIQAKQWDIDLIISSNKWLLKEIDNFELIPNIEILNSHETGTMVLWENIDKIEFKNFSTIVKELRDHLSLVFHKYLEGFSNKKKLEIYINNNKVEPFNPFNYKNLATQELAEEKLILANKEVIIQPYILPHHSKVSDNEYNQYATAEGYLKSQGFYLYRNNRIIIYGTWWGLNKQSDAHKLVRIKIDIPNDMDDLWGIDIKKSTAKPHESIKNDLKRIIKQVTEKGSRPYAIRGKKIEDKSVTRFWEIELKNNDVSFRINNDHPLLQLIYNEVDKNLKNELEVYLKGLQAYLPLDAILSRMQQNPHAVKQKDLISDEEIEILSKTLKEKGLDDDFIERLLKTEIYKDNKKLLYE